MLSFIACPLSKRCLGNLQIDVKDWCFCFVSITFLCAFRKILKNTSCTFIQSLETIHSSKVTATSLDLYKLAYWGLLTWGCIIIYPYRSEDNTNTSDIKAKIKQYAKPTAEENARCKVCFKKLPENEFFKVCCTCKRKVCEDCSATYNNSKEAEVTERSSISDVLYPKISRRPYFLIKAGFN